MSEAGVKGLKIKDVTTLYGKPYPFSFYPKSFKDLMKSNLKKALKTGKIIEQEAPVVDIKGNEIWFHSTIVPVKNGNSKIEYLMVVSIDTTRRNEAKRKLKESEEKYRVLVEESQDFIFMVNRNHEVLSVNKVAKKLFGGKVVVGKNISELFPRGTSRHYIDNLDKVFLNGVGKTIESEMFIGRKLYFISTTLNPVKDGKGNVISIFGVVRDITEKKKAENALRESEEQLKTINENITDAIFAKDKERKYTFVNPAAVKMMGKSIDKIIGRTAEEVFSKEDAQTIKRVDNLNFKGQKVSETNQLKIGGKTSFLHTTQSPIYDNNKKIIGITGVVMDVTEKRKADQALKESEKKYRELFNSMTEMFQVIELIYDKNGRAVDYIYLQVNPAFERLVKKPKEQLIGKRAKKIFGIVEPHWIKTYEEVAKTGRPKSYENYGKELDKYYDINAWKVGEKQVAIIFTDITESKKAEELLKESQKETERLFRFSGAMICKASFKGDFLRVSPGFTEVLGYSEKELLAKPFFYFIHPDDIKKTEDVIKEKLKKGIEVIRFENRYRKKDGTYLWFEWISRPIVKEGVTYAIVHDITESKKAEEELKNKNELLEKFVKITAGREARIVELKRKLKIRGKEK
jgi:PAS domain S-box-containing protein